MSFFGFDSNLPRDRGFGNAPDPFAGLSRPADDDEDALDFEDTYDGLGDQLDETDDVFNDDTFGGDETTSTKPVGRDFDFFGQTAKVADAITEEQVRYTRQQPVSKTVPTSSVSFNAPPQQQQQQQYQQPQQQQQQQQQPSRSGYEKYRDLSSLDDLRADDDLWGSGPSKTATIIQAPPAQHMGPGGRKVMSLEEAEAMMMRAQTSQAQAQPVVTAPPPGFQQHHQQGQFAPMQFQQHPGPQYSGFGHPQHFPPQNQQFPPPPQGFPSQYPQQPPPGMQHPQHQQQFGPPRPMSGHTQDQQRQGPNAHMQQPVQVLQRTLAPSPSNVPVTAPPAVQPVQILQNPARMSGPEQQRVPPVTTTIPPTGPPGMPQGPGHRQIGSNIVTHPQQLPNLTEEERAAYLMEDAKRAKRNHKIFLLSKDNGLMTPQDKNFITRIQLQQLVTATGNPNEPNDDALSEDFYYQVHNQLRGGPRQHPGQPLSNFAQTYLFQTGGRHGGMRRQARGGDNHMQRMEQQVQRAVEAAKNKPKNKQLVIEGSLGKISFSNSKTPKPLLNIKRTDSEHRQKSQHVNVTGNDRKTVLRDIENVYNTLMHMEDHDRVKPPPLTEDVDPALVGANMDWDTKDLELNQKLWEELKIATPIGGPAMHPFVAFLSFSKGKKAIPRIFRHISQQQRTIIWTMIAIHLDQLDVVREAVMAPGETLLSASIRENIELFSLAVMPSLFGYLNEAGLDVVTSLLSLILDRTNIEADARTRIGLSMLTMILSRAELIKQATDVDEQEWNNWVLTYNKFFNAVEPWLPYIFPGTVNSGEDVYVWQFLAAIGVGASPDQQQRLVMAVKDRVMETVNLAKTLPPAMSSQRLANVNLFMRSIGLDVELLV